jgi:hypothetical protein
VLCQLSYAPWSEGRLYPRLPPLLVRQTRRMGSLGLAALFGVLTCAFAGIAAGSALAGRWVIAVAAGALAAWMGSLASTAVRRRRR